jgi:ubiquinone biosynthesis monooxygenase Coq7
MTSFRKKLEEIIRVDHAGEFGAKVIYNGQIAALRLKKDYKTLELVEKMQQQENVHFSYFDAEIKKQKIRPTIMQPIWKIGGFALGFLSAIIDKKAAMACTSAVEEIIEQHYLQQLTILKKEEIFLDERQKQEVTLLKENIEKFRDEELNHRDIAYDNRAAELNYFKPFAAFVKFTTKFAIALSKKI